jgi:hypothetical protein
MHLCVAGDVAHLSPLIWISVHPGNWPAWLGGLAYLLLVFTPGAWISFGFPLRGVSFFVRVCLAVILSPAIVCAEFYALRLPGVSFSLTAVLMVFINLPAAYLVWRRRTSLQEVGRGDWLIGIISVLIPLACMGSVLGNPIARIYTGHSILHADPIYMMVRGDLVPEAPTLAGVRMSYPVWSGLPFEAIHSYLTQSPPEITYVWSNLFLLMAVCGFAAGIGKEMGGGRAAQASAAIFLLLGTNPVGWVLMEYFPMRNFPQVWGDHRFTPWVNKFLMFGPMTMGIAMTMAIIYLLVRPGKITGGVFTILGLLLCSIGLFYPLLFPSACGVLFARALVDAAGEQGWSFKVHAREVLGLAGLVLLASALTYTEVHFMTAARHNSVREVLLSTLPGAARKLFGALVSTSVFLIGLALTFRRLFKVQRRATLFLLAGAAASYLLYVVFFIPFYENEHKFIFVAAMCLAVFPALAVERIWQEWRRAAAIPVLILAGLLVVGAYGDWVYRDWPTSWLGSRSSPESRPPATDLPLNSDGFFLQLNGRDQRFGICNAVRSLTPDSSVLLVDNNPIYYPAVTNRSLYVPAENRIYPGVNLAADTFDMDVSGYGSQIVLERRAIQAEFFDSKDASIRESALHTVQELNRPIAVIVDAAHPDLLNWLKANKTAHELYGDNSQSLWLIDRT